LASLPGERSRTAQVNDRSFPLPLLPQFDTLPIRVGRVEQLEPGDLIFWAGDYVNPQAKASPFGMTHVEIFVGGETGEGVIGEGLALPGQAAC
jgi:hypothetical protein